MNDINFLIILATAIIPLLIGSIWYNPKVLGNAWMLSAGLTEEKLKDANMLKIFGFTLLFSVFIAFSLMPIVIHQAAVMSAFGGFDVLGSDLESLYNEVMTAVGEDFRTFGHGALHGGMTGFLLAMPILGINALFERKGFKYIAIHTGYWMITLALMGGIICQFA